MDADELKRELQRLAERLDRIERVLKIEPASPPTSAAAPPTLPKSETSPHRLPDEKVLAFRRLQTAETQQREATPPTTPPLPPTTKPREAPTAPRPTARVAPRPIPAPVPSKPPPPISTPKEPVSLEMLIGGKWMAWVGAIVVLLAVAFAILVGIQRGWWGQLLPQVRCLLIAGFGAALLVGGEIALRRIGRAASVGCFAAGLGTLYMDAYATFRFFDLLGIEWAFVLMAIVAVIGFAITWRTKFLTIGVLSIIGGFATPWLLRDQQAHDLELLAYLTMLLGISLGLSAASPREFRPLRFVALGALGVTAGAWIIANAAFEWLLAIVFMSAWWFGVMAESVYAALRRQTAIANVIAVVLSTAAFVTAGCWVLWLGPPAPVTVPAGPIAMPTLLVSNWLGVFTLMVALLGAVAAFQFGPGLEGLRARPTNAIEKLALALWTQAGVLLALAIALQFRGFAQSIGWMAVALAAIEIGRRLPSRGVTVFGLVVGALALLRVTVLDWAWPGMRNAITTAGEITITKWSILALVTIVAMHIAAHRLRPKPKTIEPLPILLAGAAAVFWLILAALQCRGLTATAAWLLGAVVLLALERFGRRQRYFEIGLILLILAAARWLLMDAFMRRMDPTWRATDSLPVLNWQMALAAATAAVGWWACRIMRKRETASADRTSPIAPTTFAVQNLILAASLFTLIALSFETDRLVERFAAASANLWWSIGHVRQLALTLLWTIGSLAIGILARAVVGRRTPTGSQLLVQFAWMLLILCALKWVIGDSLYWTMVNRRAQMLGAAPIANLQMIVGAALALGFMTLAAITRRGDLGERDSQLTGEISIEPSQFAPVAASFMALWGLTFEVDRALGRMTEMPQWLSIWHPVQLRLLWWTGLWAVGGLAMMLIGRWRRLHGMVQAGWMTIAAAAIAWLTIDTLLWRMNIGATRAAVLFNLQFMMAALLVVLLAVGVTWFRNQSAAVRDSRAPQNVPLNGAGIGLGLIAAIGLWAGSLEIDRFFIGDPMRVQFGLSVYWGAYGVLMVLIGFARRAAVARYVGLGLLGVTLVKAFIIDMKEVELFWRSMIFGVLGLLLIGTSMLYLKLSPRLLSQREG